MKLNMLVLMSADAVKLPEGTKFRWCVHHIAEGLLQMLPRRFELDGSSKVQLSFGPRGSESTHFQCLGSTRLFVEDFDFGRFLSLSGSERDLLVLESAEKSLCWLATEHGGGDEVAMTIREAAEKLRQCDFRLRIPVPKLSKTDPNRQWKTEVVRHLDREHGEAWSLEVVAKDGRRSGIMWMKGEVGYLDRTDFFKKLTWVDGEARIMTNLGRVVFAVRPEAVVKV